MGAEDERADGPRQLSDEEFEELYDRARLALKSGRADEALELARQLVAARPGSTTAHELLGDAMAALDRWQEAADEYKKAAELEPANADAHTKYGQAILRLKDEEFQRRMMQLELEGRAFRGFSNPQPEAAALRSGLFPGLGQLYNGEYEKGIALGAAALVTLGIAVHGLMGTFSPEGTEPPYASIMAVIGAALFFSIYVFSIWDAIKGAREQSQLRSLFRQTKRPEE